MVFGAVTVRSESSLILDMTSFSHLRGYGRSFCMVILGPTAFKVEVVGSNTVGPLMEHAS